MKNKFCELSSLRNEADVEQSFARRLIEELGYGDLEILPKQSLSAHAIKGMRGHKAANYKPDFAIKVKKAVRWIFEAKAPNEKLDSHEWQPRGYCILLNGLPKTPHRVAYHVLSNGKETRLYDPTVNDPLLVLNFSDFADGNAKFKKLKALLGRASITEEAAEQALTLTLRKLALPEINAAFGWCHQQIYRKDNISQSAAFTEFVKLISLKLISDRKIRDKHPEILENDHITVPVEEVDFSEHWVSANSRNTPNPVNDILFQGFMREMERDIAQKRRKRIFNEAEPINLKPETILGVVRKLEDIFLFGIDADLNGRLFETFLSATMRGKDLGQFFTPRSLVKVGIKLAQFKVHVPTASGGTHTDTVLDACCGTGGFLIDALADMWTKAERLNLSQTEKAVLKRDIANNSIVGVDVANDPKLARIARLNMFLHGDGGSRIFHLNALDKELPDVAADSPEITKEKEELRELFKTPRFDVALTNPPFAKALDRESDEERKMLDSYVLGNPGAKRGSVRSSLLFIERYYDLLKPGGRLVTVIDDGILGGDDYAEFRAQLRKWFLIRAVVSLPGDAFQRSNARVKTSYLVAEKRQPNTTQEQPPVFMYPCRFVGIDDPKRQRARAGDAEARKRAEQEIKEVAEEFEKFLAGDSKKYAVSADRVAGRMDVKFCLYKPGRSIPAWKKQQFSVKKLSDLLEPRVYSGDNVITKEHDEPVRVLVVRYGGYAESIEEIMPADGSYSELFPVRAGDVVVSNIAASHGSIAVVPRELDGCVVSSEYSVLKPKDGVDSRIVQLIMRSPEVRADILLSASGANRTRTRWELMCDIAVPYPGEGLIKKTLKFAKEAEEAEKRAAKALQQARDAIETELALKNSLADRILMAFRPPK